MTIEALVRIVDKTDPKNAINDAWLTKAGDVIVVCPQGWKWSKEELNNPEWVILRIKNMSLAEGQSYMTPQSGDPLITPKLKRRAKGLNFAQMQAVLVGKAAPFNTIVDVTDTQVRAWSVIKPIDNTLIL